VSDILIEDRADARWVRFNRPARKNSYDEAMCKEAIAAIRSARDVTAVVITGSGDSFCAGGYLAELVDPDQAALRSMFFSSLEQIGRASCRERV